MQVAQGNAGWYRSDIKWTVYCHKLYILLSLLLHHDSSCITFCFLIYISSDFIESYWKRGRCRRKSWVLDMVWFHPFSVSFFKDSLQPGLSPTGTGLGSPKMYSDTDQALTFTFPTEEENRHTYSKGLKLRHSPTSALFRLDPGLLLPLGSFECTVTICGLKDHFKIQFLVC